MIPMESTNAIPLRDGRTLDIEVLTFPIDSARQNALIGLWRTEWTGGDYDWLRSMNGDYSRHLRIQAALGTIEGRPAGTASVCYSCREPEVSVVGSVLTHPGCRRLGVAEALTSAVVDLSFRAGCRVSYLGATRDPRNVYLRCGFRWWNGGVMRLAREDSSGCEEDFFAPGQATSVREANWGDLAAFACFVVQPWDALVLDYPRALLSGKYVKLQRCVSNFPAVREEAVPRGGVLGVLEGGSPHRVLGFGSITPEPGEYRRHKAVIDVCSHDNYAGGADSLTQWLISKAAGRGVEQLQAYVAASDADKQERFRRFGLKPLARLPGQIRLEGREVDVLVLEGPAGRGT